MQQYRYTLSVFLAESGAHKLPQLSHADLLRLAGVVPGSRVHALLTARSAAGGGSLAAVMVEALGALESAAPTVSTGAQTEEQPAASAALLARLGAIEAEFAQRSAALEAASARSLEERMAEFQRSCEARYREQLAAEVARVREGEVAVVREAEAARHAQQLAAEREALQRGYQEQLDKLRTQVGLMGLATAHGRHAYKWQHVTLHAMQHKVGEAMAKSLTCNPCPAGGGAAGESQGCPARLGPHS